MHVKYTLSSVINENTQALFVKTRITLTVRTWCDSQGFDEAILTFPILQSYFLMHFMLFYYAHIAKLALVACSITKMQPYTLMHFVSN